MFTKWAIEALDVSDSSLAKDISKSLAAVAPKLPPDLRNCEVNPPGESIRSPHFVIDLDVEHGGVVSLVDSHGREWASESEPLFEFQYISSNTSDFDLFDFEINGTNACYSKSGLQEETCASHMGCAKSQIWKPDLTKVFVCRAAGLPVTFEDVRPTLTGPVDRILLHLEMPSEAHPLYGAHSDAWVELVLPHRDAEILVDLQWMNKTPTRIPEALFFNFPVSTTRGVWQLDKLGSRIDPREVLAGSTSHLHAVGDGGATLMHDGDASVKVVSFDSALVSVVLRSAFPSPLNALREAQARGPLYFPLQNNYWNTNYPFRYPFGNSIKNDASSRFRFAMSCLEEDSATRIMI